MSVVLSGDLRVVYMPQWEWLNTLSLAKNFGWAPRGTSPNRELGYTDEGYEFSAHQEVSGGDAHHLANALERAMGQFVDRGWSAVDAERASPSDLVIVPATFGVKYIFAYAAPPDKPVMCSREMLATWYRALESLVTLCREGSFRIW